MTHNTVPEVQVETIADQIETMPLDLTKEEKLRTAALTLAIQYHVKTIVDNGDLYRELRRDGKELSASTVDSVVTIAVNFEAYLRGDFSSNKPNDSSE